MVRLIFFGICVQGENTSGVLRWLKDSNCTTKNMMWVSSPSWRRTASSTPPSLTSTPEVPDYQPHLADLDPLHAGLECHDSSRVEGHRGLPVGRLDQAGHRDGGVSADLEDHLLERHGQEVQEPTSGGLHTRCLTSSRSSTRRRGGRYRRVWSATCSASCTKHTATSVECGHEEGCVCAVISFSRLGIYCLCGCQPC